MTRGNVKEGILKLAIICRGDMSEVWVSIGYKRNAGWRWCPVVDPDLPCRNQPTKLSAPHAPLPSLISLVRRFA